MSVGRHASIGEVPDLANVFIQSITTRWTKMSRSAPGAVARNAVPEAISFRPVSGRRGRSHGVLLHAVEFSEPRGFSHPEEGLDEEDPSRLPELLRISLERASDELRVSFVGRPDRPLPRPRHAFSLRPNEWAQLVYNWREPLESTWAYAKRVVNVRLDGAPSPGMFLSTEPIARAEYLAELRYS